MIFCNTFLSKVKRRRWWLSDRFVWSVWNSTLRWAQQKLWFCSNWRPKPLSDRWWYERQGIGC